MDRIVVKTKVSSDGSVRLDLPHGDARGRCGCYRRSEGAGCWRRAYWHLISCIPGWSECGLSVTDIDDNHAFARRLREQAQTRRHD